MGNRIYLGRLTPCGFFFMDFNGDFFCQAGLDGFGSML